MLHAISPYCQKSVGVLKELRCLCGEKIRIVYRDYPDPNHPMRHKPPKPPNALESRIGRTTRSSLTGKPQGKDGTFMLWRSNWDSSRTPLRPD